jgi:hypothetical protein
MKLKPLAQAPAPVKMTLELETPKLQDIQPLRPADAVLKLVSADHGDVLKAIAGTQAHVLIASDDLSWFDHEHTTVAADATMKVKLALPHAGSFVIFTDPESPSQPLDIAPLSVKVPGQAPPTTKLAPNEGPRRLADGYMITIDKHEPIKAGAPATLTFAVSRNDQGVADLEPYFGSPGHLVLISQDLTRLVHAHASGVHGHDHGPATPASGPDLSFDVTFPAPGLYGAWLQFQHQGKMMTAPFTLEVKP